LPAGHAIREDAGPAPPDAVAPRPDSAFGGRTRVLLACSRGAEQRDIERAEHAHRFARLSRAGTRLAGDGAEPQRAVAALAAGGQARFDGRHPVLPAGRGRHRCASAGAHRGRQRTPMNELLAKLKVWYGALQQREQRMVAGGALTLAALILVLGVLL